MRAIKDSKIDTIGMVPSSWRQRRLKYLCRVQTGNEDTQNANPDGQYPFFVRSPIQERCDRYTFDGEGILVAGDGAGAGRIFHHAFGKYAVHQRVYRLSEFLFPSRFLFYWLSLLFPYEMDKGSAQSTVPSMRLPMLLNFSVFMPSKEEALSISSFLDSKCAEIDALMEDIRAEISTLEEYKKSVITEAVTKGLNPDAEMKDSGIAWVGEIPGHWEIVNPKSLFTLRKDKAFSGQRQLTASQQYGVIYQDEYMNLTGNKVVIVEKDFDILKQVKAGDFVISMRSFQGGLEYSPYDGSISSAYNMLIPNTARVHNSYYKWLLKSPGYIRALQSTSNLIRDGQAMRYSNFAKVPLPSLPLKEQQTIADYLDPKCAEIEATIAEKQKQLTILEEYKKSLIYEYVTGKKEVPTL